jgi:shikimate kinase
MKRTNLVLIGMPASGKSTVGVILAKLIGFDFMDTDLLIQRAEKRRLSQIIEAEGIDGFLEIENRINASVDVDHCVIATGGSAS